MFEAAGPRNESKLFEKITAELMINVSQTSVRITDNTYALYVSVFVYIKKEGILINILVIQPYYPALP